MMSDPARLMNLAQSLQIVELVPPCGSRGTVQSHAQAPEYQLSYRPPTGMRPACRSQIPIRSEVSVLLSGMNYLYLRIQYPLLTTQTESHQGCHYRTGQQPLPHYTQC